MSEKSLERLPSLNALRAFEAAGRRLSFRLAAHELNVTQAAISQQIRALEKALGFSLFHRFARHIELTHAGRMYLADISRAFTLLSDATRAARQEKGRVTLSVHPSFAARWLMPRLRQISKDLPEVELRLTASETLADLQQDSTDLVIRQGRMRQEPNLRASLLFDQEIIAVASPDYLADHSSPLDSTSLEALIFLHDTDNHWPMFLQAALGLQSYRTKLDYTFNLSMLAIEGALSGLGIALVTKAYVQAELAAGKLVQIFPISVKTNQQFYLMHRSNLPLSPSSILLRDWLLRECYTETLPLK